MLVTMNDKEIFRLGTIRDVCEKRIKRKDAAQLLNVSVRQVQRLITRYRDLSAVGLVHQRRGQSLGNKINADIRSQRINLIHEYYIDFGPTLAREKLIERHDIKIGLETLRQWMIADGLGFHISNVSLASINLVIVAIVMVS